MLEPLGEEGFRRQLRQVLYRSPLDAQLQTLGAHSDLGKQT